MSKPENNSSNHKPIPPEIQLEIERRINEKNLAAYEKIIDVKIKAIEEIVTNRFKDYFKFVSAIIGLAAVALGLVGYLGIKETVRSLVTDVANTEVKKKLDKLDEIIKSTIKEVEKKRQQAEKKIEKATKIAKTTEPMEITQGQKKIVKEAAEEIKKKSKEEYSADDYFVRGFQAGIEGKYNKSIELSQKAIQLKPDFPEAYNNLGAVYEKKGKYDQAIETLNKAIQLNPDYSDAYNNLGAVYGKIGKYDQAIEACKKAIQLNPDDSLAYANLGAAYGKIGKYDQAIEACNKAIQLNPDDSLAYTNLGAVYGKIGKYDQAIEACKKAIQLKPDFPDAYANLANTYLRVSKYDQAIEACNKAIQLNPDYSDAYYNLACAYSLKKDKDNALKYLEIAIDKGWHKLKHIEEDSDLDFIRDTPEYERIIKKLKDKLQR